MKGLRVCKVSKEGYDVFVATYKGLTLEFSATSRPTVKDMMAMGLTLEESVKVACEVGYELY